MTEGSGFARDFGFGSQPFDSEAWEAEKHNHGSHMGDPFAYLHPDTCEACARLLARMRASA